MGEDPANCSFNDVQCSLDHGKTPAIVVLMLYYFFIPQTGSVSILSDAMNESEVRVNGAIPS